MELSP